MGAYKYYNPSTGTWEIVKSKSIIKPDGSLEYTPDDIKGIDDKINNLSTDVDLHKAEKVHQGEIHGFRLVEGKLEYFNGTEWQRVKGDGYPVGNISNFNAKEDDMKVILTWQDPEDVTITDSNDNVITIARWKGTKILRKTGSYSQNENDGVLVVDNGIRNQYAESGFTDIGLQNDVEYFYMAFPYTEEDVYTVDEANRVSATPTEIKIYGVVIDEANSNPETAVTYTDDAIGFTPMKGNNGNFQWGSWENIFNDLEIEPVMVKNGVEQYKLNPNDFTKKIDGTNADIASGNDGDVLIKFSKIYWKMWKTGTNQYVQWSTKMFDGAKCPAHTVGASEKDKIYISAYMGHNLSGKLRSLSGKTPTASQTIGTFRTQAQANGNGYQQMGYYPLLMLQVLYITFFKDRDSQTALGRGYVDGNSASIATGGTNTKGMFYGETTGKQQNKFCGIEDFYGNVFYWIDGFFSDASRNMMISKQDVFNDNGSGYVNHGQGATANLSGYIGSVQGGTDTGFVIKTIGGSEATQYADYGRLKASCLPSFGGHWDGGSSAGAFRLYVGRAASYSHSYLSSRLACLV